VSLVLARADGGIMAQQLYWKKNELFDGLWHIPLGEKTFCGKERPVSMGDVKYVTFTEPDLCQDCLVRETLRLMGRDT
jgi:hypothetical protein